MSIIAINQQRYKVALILCLANALCYACRMNIGIALPYFVKDKRERGLVLSSFFYGYICTQVPAGYLSKRLGVHQVLAIGVLVWTVCDLLTVFAFQSIPLLSLMRVGMGCGEGVTMTSLHIFASHWFPINERTTLVAMVTSGSDLGNILALWISPWLIQMSGGQWQVIYVFTSIVTMVWFSVYMKNVSNKPEEHPHISRKELEFIQRGLNDEQSSESPTRKKTKAVIPWRILLTNRYLWVIYASHFCANYAWYILLGWLPTYLTEALGLNLSDHPGLTIAPHLSGYVGLLIFGRLSDYLITQRNIRTIHVRKLMHCIGTFLPALFLYWLPYTPSPIVSIGLLSGCLFFGRACTSGFWINMIDVGGSDHAGSIMSISNSVGTLPGILGNLVTGYLLQHQQSKVGEGSWTRVFHLASAVSAMGGVIFLLGATDRNVFEPDQSRKNKKDEVDVNVDQDPLLFES